MANAAQPISSVHWDGAAPVILDQWRLPGAVVHWRLATVDDVVLAIQSLAVRGAPAIGITGAYGVVVGLDESRPASPEAGLAVLDPLVDRLAAARPTAVNLPWAVRRVATAARAVAAAGADVARVRAAALAAATAIHDEDRLACPAMTAEQATRELLTELLRNFYARNWVSGTGGGICGPAEAAGCSWRPPASTRNVSASTTSSPSTPRTRRGRLHRLSAGHLVGRRGAVLVAGAPSSVEAPRRRTLPGAAGRRDAAVRTRRSTILGRSQVASAVHALRLPPGSRPPRLAAVRSGDEAGCTA